MFRRRILVSLMATTMIVTPVTRALADNNAAALLGGAILGGIIVNEVNKNKQRKRAATTTTRPSAGTSSHSYQRAQNRDIQTALNYFGYPAGTADGVLGRRSRAAIAQFQAEMGYTADGYLDDYERDFLLSSYQRALASSQVPPYNQILAAQGPRGLLRTYRNEQLGIATQTPQQAPGTNTATPAPAPAARSNTAALPSFPVGGASRSINDHCNEVSVLTAANGGLTTAGRVRDPQFALNEQFCLARTHAMAESARLEASIPNMTPDQIEQQCAGLAQAMEPYTATVATDRPERVIADAAQFLRSSGQPMDQLAAGGRICLGVGYRTDNAQMALASAVLLSAAGELGYGEVVAHHLREGFGVSQAQPKLAQDWMQMSVNAVKNGGTPVLGQSADRLAVLEAATNGAAPAGGGALPVFPSSSGN